MIAISLQSGSNGNCIYVEAGGVRLLLDAGISARRAEQRLAARGRDIRQVDAVILSHDHGDHVRAAGIYQRKFRLPLYATAATLEVARTRSALGAMGEVHHFRRGQELRFGKVRVHTIPTPHDGVDGVAFVVEAEGRRLGVLTDLGHVFGGLGGIIASLDAVFLESNHDVEMLARGSYPPAVKQRIRGPGGHLSNVEAAELLGSSAGPGLKWACLAHLSQENNAPGLALRTHREILASRLPLLVAGRYAATDALEV